MAQARQAAAKVTAALPAAVTKRPNSTGVPPPYRRLWRQLDADCGSGWQQQYADLHADIVAGRRPERIVVSLATPTGARHNSCCNAGLLPAQHDASIMQACLYVMVVTYPCCTAAESSQLSAVCAAPMHYRAGGPAAGDRQRLLLRAADGPRAAAADVRRSAQPRGGQGGPKAHQIHQRACSSCSLPLRQCIKLRQACGDHCVCCLTWCERMLLCSCGNVSAYR